MKLAYMYATPDVALAPVTAIQGEIGPTLARIRRTGYTGVELLVRDPRRIDAAALEAAVRLEGLDMPAICTGEVYGEDGLSFADPNPQTRLEARERMLASLELASRFDAMVNVGRLRGRYVDGIDPRQTLDWIAESITACAERYPATAVVMEPVNRHYANCLLNTVETLDFIRSVDLPNLGIMLDSVHMMVEGEDIAASMRASGRHFWHFHISDSDRLPVGQGSYGIEAFMDALRALGFQRYVTVETFQIPDGERAIQESFDSLRPYFN
jgi:sugar phosphate isomerase/epimerase